MPKIRPRNNRKGIGRSVFYVVRAMPIARQQVTKHIPTEVYHGTIGRPYLGNGVVNSPTNCWKMVLSAGSTPKLYNVVFHVSCRSSEEL
jgi:hypothetical protein